MSLPIAFPGRRMSRHEGVMVVRGLIDRRALAQPDHTFLISPRTCVLTFKDFQERSPRLHRRLRQLGLEAGNRIAFLLDNGRSTAQLFLGAMYGGFVAVPKTSTWLC